MRNLLLFYSLLFLFSSCKESPKLEVVVKGQSVTRLPVSLEKVRGMYNGEFKGSPLSIVINHITDKHAGGYTLHRGKTRNLSGVVVFSEGKLHLYLVEPGDSRFDGQFHLAVDTNLWKGEGTWKSFVTGSEIPFRFQKREIKKDGNGRIFVDNLSNYIVLKPDGTCTYSYQGDTTNAATPVIVNGRYKKEKNKVTIYWQKSGVYPSGKSTFHLLSEKAFKGENYIQQSLRGEGRVFSEMVFK